MPCTHRSHFHQLQVQGADFLLTVKGKQKTLHRQIRRPFQGKQHIPFLASDHEISHGRSITWTLRAKQATAHIREAWSGTSWIVELAATGTRDGKLMPLISSASPGAPRGATPACAPPQKPCCN
jgi:hypothetical protein